VEGLGNVAAPLVHLADDDLAGMVVVLDGAPLAQELGVHRDAEAIAYIPARILLNQGDQTQGAGPRQHGAAHHHDVVSVLIAERVADLPAHVFDVLQVQASVAIAGRADADQADVARGHRIASARGRHESPGANALRDQLIQAGLDDWGSARSDRLDLLRIAVDPDNLVSVVRQARGGDTADVAKAEHTDLHGVLLLR